ncbi:hypothetical protein KUTeg_016935 [Tegillarca granosa]|uniref:PHD-type domain-containing protein n=1 Tax=Tegillarca granosa TaxID=220873 RepID=A0ABQ9ESL3_TEGGR|nr:hypothetical protein KUTeg_016935 [Tegillarca granosa]
MSINLLRELSKQKKVAVTATTGMASTQLGYEASTLHHWCGILDGRYSHDHLAELFENDDKFAAAKHRIKDTDCLMIDEISMLSKKTLELVEFVCRHVIVCGDFKQLPPVPNHRLNDDGAYCIESETFKKAFPHHVNLTKVVRQEEADLIKAVHGLCDGNPDDETIQLMLSLDRPLPDNMETIHLYGTNFDVNYVNHDMLESMDGQEYIFRSTDKAHLNVPKTLVLKEGAPIILIRNIQQGLFNGAKGIVHLLKRDSPPVISIDGKIISLESYDFDVYDMDQRIVLASRTQYPVMLAFAMTVHRAQCQTLQYVDVDCKSFFAPGQMGVAIGRVQSKAGLRVRNFNRQAAVLKHPPCVYQFYSQHIFKDPAEDGSCCKSDFLPSSQLSCETFSQTSSDTEDPSLSEGDFGMDIDLEQLDHPWNIRDFLSENASSACLSSLTDDFFHSDLFEEHVRFLYFKVNEITLKPFQTSTSQQWNSAYVDLNKFLSSVEYNNACKKLFQVHGLSKQQNKLCTKLMFWLMDKQIDMKAQQIVAAQKEALDTKDTPDIQHSSAGQAKIRYIAGVCINKISSRLKNSVIRKIGKTFKKSKIARMLDYKKQKLLQNFRIKEDEAPGPGETSMAEIQNKQGPTRGLTIVSDDVFQFFIKLNSFLQKKSTLEYFHLYGENIFQHCRNIIDSNDELIQDWISLFGGVEDNIKDEIFLTLIMELFKDVTEHFVRVAFVDALKLFKQTVPRKKKQALRSKLTALGERDEKRKKSSDDKVESAQGSSEYSCSICKQFCEWEPTSIEYESIACDKCNSWCHYKCVNIKGNESFLMKKSGTWFCPKCSKKSKGRGKGKGKNELLQ